MSRAVGGNFPYLFEVIGRPDAVSINYLPSPPRANDLIQFSSGRTYIVTGMTWTPSADDAVGRVRLVPLDDEEDDET